MKNENKQVIPIPLKNESFFGSCDCPAHTLESIVPTSPVRVVPVAGAS